MSDDATPTQRLETAMPTPAATPATQASSRLLIALLVVGSVLVVGVIAILVLLITRDGHPVAAAPSPTASLSPTPTSSDAPPVAAPQEQAPELPGARFTEFSPGQEEVTCVNGSDESPFLQVSWDSTHAVSAWIWADVDDAYGLVDIPVRGGSDNIPDDFRYPCDRAQTTFIITLVGEDGAHLSQKWTIKNVGELL